jgi:hypothetical protein
MNYLPPPTPPTDPVVFSYFDLRKTVGIIGFALPFVLALGKIITGSAGVQHSISDYYYTDMRNFLVGGLCGIGLFLFATKGYDHRDAVASRLSCIFALGVAFFPTRPEVIFHPHQKIVGYFHDVFATLLFVTLGFFCLFQFTQTDPNRKPTTMKRTRNNIYTICGYTIFFCIVLSGVFGAIDHIEKRLVWPIHLFCFESVAILAFGFAWLTKGELFFKDR